MKNNDPPTDKKKQKLPYLSDCYGLQPILRRSLKVKNTEILFNRFSSGFQQIRQHWRVLAVWFVEK
ncbi:hypothetical protein [Enterobacter mori]|uniref:hypothetical protein n=1 Tax=Enterobacter mori TaxID=539813 RepID=UPI001C66E6E2|nr:hypothetical protein [Enterobacter mori]MBW8249039.1 hypothetical protein [Enterobacter mori]MBW8254266.1 hypothetical protein [Enterobacter mori]